MMVDFIAKRIHHRTFYAWDVVIMLIFEIKGIIKVKRVQLCRFFFIFFLIMLKNWAGGTTLNEEKRGDALLI